MNPKEQFSAFLEWLTAKQTELADGYWLQTIEGQEIYRRMLLMIHAEITTTEQLLKTI